MSEEPEQEHSADEEETEVKTDAVPPDIEFKGHEAQLSKDPEKRDQDEYEQLAEDVEVTDISTEEKEDE